MRFIVLSGFFFYVIWSFLSQPPPPPCEWPVATQRAPASLATPRQGGRQLAWSGVVSPQMVADHKHNQTSGCRFPGAKSTRSATPFYPFLFLSSASSLSSLTTDSAAFDFHHFDLFFPPRIGLFD